MGDAPPQSHIDDSSLGNRALDDFFARTFGQIIARHQAQRCLHDERFQSLVQHEPFHLTLPLTGRIVYGTGQRCFNLNLYRRRLTFWNTDAGAYVRGFEPINYTVPFLIMQQASGYRGVFVDNTFRGTVDIGLSHPDELVFAFEGPARGVHTYDGATLAEVLAQFTGQTGRMPMQPLWALGHHQSRYSYMTQQEVLAVARQFRARAVPCDALYLDIDYMDSFKVFTWNRERFPDFKGMIDELHDMGFRVVVILDPGVKVEEGYSAYDSGMNQKIFLTLPDGTPAEGVVWPGETYHPDFSREATRRWWACQAQPLLEAGVDGIWNDMNEPLYFGVGEAVSPPDYLLHQLDDGSTAFHLERHNLYGHEMSLASRLAMTQHAPQRRPFNITRAGCAGTQAVASSWTGDNQSTWDDLRLSIAMNLNMALSGQSFTGPDLGGFALDTSPELLVRWYQACLLFPFYRNHSANDTIPQEPWRFGSAVEVLIRQAVELRYALLPYLYTVMAQCHFDGTPMLQPLCALEPASACAHNIDDSYLVGAHLLVAPVLDAHTLRRAVYLPSACDWWTFDRVHRYAGGQTIMVEAPLNTVPLFVRAGTALPLWPLLQTTMVPLPTPIIRVYAGHGITRLYQDAGDGFGYQSGEYAWTTFTVSGTQLAHTTQGNPAWSRFTLE